jgi:hypothetical protein
MSVAILLRSISVRKTAAIRYRQNIAGNNGIPALPVRTVSVERLPNANDEVTIRPIACATVCRARVMRELGPAKINWRVDVQVAGSRASIGRSTM